MMTTASPDSPVLPLVTIKVATVGKWYVVWFSYKAFWTPFLPVQKRQFNFLLILCVVLKKSEARLMEKSKTYKTGVNN